LESDLGMKLSFVEPHHELKPYIQSFWVFESPDEMPPAENSLAAPNGCPKLIISSKNAITSIANGEYRRVRNMACILWGTAIVQRIFVQPQMKPGISESSFALKAPTRFPGFR
jgi:hypothetical protein